MWSKLSKKVRLLICIGVPVLAVLVVGTLLTLGFLLPWLQAENTMDPDGLITIYQQQDGSLLVTWSLGENADSYTLDVLSSTGESLYSQTTAGECSCVLPELPDDEVLTLRIRSAHGYRNTQRPGEKALQAQLTLKTPEVSQLEYTVDPDTDLMDVSFQMEEDDMCLVYTDQEPYAQTGRPFLELEQKAFTVSFGEDGQFPVPEYGQEARFSFQLYRYGENFLFVGGADRQIVLKRQDFLGSELDMTATDNGSNCYTLTWNETKGERYEIQCSQDNLHWNTLHTVAKDGELSYTTDHLTPFETFWFQVVALDEAGQLMSQSSVELVTAQRTVYSTIWPIMEQQVYADTDKQTVLGNAPAGTAYCVLEEKDGFFAIQFGETTGYIDSNYCMINLPEYMGDLCAYNITNSYSSIYMVHEFAIENVTDTVIKGYENVQLSQDTYLVPLLYPAAKKLVVAGLDARNQGYRLKLYDTFRPQAATVSIYDRTALLIDELVPKSAYTGKPLKDLDDMQWELTQPIPQWVLEGYPKDSKGDYIKPDPVSLAQQPTPEPTQPETTEPTQAETTEPTVPEITDEQFQQQYLMRDLTYQIFMTDNGRYKLSNFLAKGRSNHNLGIAMDLTLEKISDQKATEMPMQTSIHDLSWFSETARNNSAARTLRQIMTDAGFGGLTSEWWHFQDNDARDTLELQALYNGISAKGWIRDDHGWRYRLNDGSCYQNCTKEIDNIAYTFDEKGYVVE